VATPAGAERAALCDLFLDVGPDAATLLPGWTTRDLAAHLVVRERRPDAAPGMFVPALAAYSERVRAREKRRPWKELVERVRRGPPLWNPMQFEPIDALANTVEFFVHHEDVRRARAGWKARALSTDLEVALAASLERMGGLLTRKARVGLLVAPNGRREIRLHAGDPVVTVRGPIGEAVLYTYGRKDVARVTLDGNADATAAIAATPFGL
jgi:uncharacterized protein (TIGR03085 family)